MLYCIIIIILQLSFIIKFYFSLKKTKKNVFISIYWFIPINESHVTQNAVTILSMDYNS